MNEDDSLLPSGKILIRIPTSIHKWLRAEARREGVSINTLIIAKLTPTLRDLLDARNK